MSMALIKQTRAEESTRAESMHNRQINLASHVKV